MDNAEFIGRLSISEFRRFKKAVNTLCRIGIEYDVAIATIINAMQNRSSLTRKRVIYGAGA